MKKVLFLLSFFIAMIYSLPTVKAQNTGYVYDTLITSSSTDTLILYPGGSTHFGASSAALAKLFNGRGTLDVYMETDSISGTTAGTVKLQYGHGSSPTIWYDKTTTTLNGAAVQKVLTEDTAYGFNKFRLYCTTTGSTTQKTRVKFSWAWKANL